MTYDNDEIFDPDSVEIEDNYSLLPNGKYLLQASSVEIVEKDGGAKLMYKVEFEVVEGDYHGRKIFENINLRNPSEQAVSIGRQTLAKLLRAIGQGAFPMHQAADALCWKPFIGKVGVQKDKSGNYEDSNRVKSYEPYNNGQSEAPERPAQTRPNTSTARSTGNGGASSAQRQDNREQEPARAASGGGSRPWDRNKR